MRRTHSPGAGNQRELKVMAVLADEGWLCGSRRHIPGPGDVLAVHAVFYPRLIEVKSTAGGPYERFGPSDREAMVEASLIVGAEPWLAWWPARGKLRWIGALEWPDPKPKSESLREAWCEDARQQNARRRLSEPADLPGHGTVETAHAPLEPTWPEDEGIARDLP